jgi:mRNA-degrading endonuclease RelE of RelBE toxin-antitoxin system
MLVVQTARFSRSLKRLHDNGLDVIDDAIKYLASNPSEGVLKGGNLAGIHVYKLKVGDELKLLAYTCNNDTLELVDYGCHENFYRDLKRYVH